MMRGQRAAAVAIRRESGDILLHEEALAPRTEGIARWPFVRGLLLLWDMLILGTRMMLLATNVVTQDQARMQAAAANTPAEALPLATTPTPSTGRIIEDRSTPEAAPGGLGAGGVALTMLVSLSFAVGLFFLAPLALAGLARPLVGNGIGALALEGAIRLVILIVYLAAIGRVASVRRVFEYHGAEHKTINAFEAGEPLDVEHVRAASRVHTRCGTGFLLIVVVLSIFVFALLGHPPLPLLILSRIVFVPLIASVAYELMRLGAANYRFRVVRWLLQPGLALQGLTTREPDATQIECAIVALQRVLTRDGVAALERVA